MMTAKKERKHPWRDNLETLTGAIVLAMIFKAFLLEISRIPSPSMQPTLMGMPENGISDRVLVDKLSFHLRDPQRWEIVVFKHPIERSRNMVKRLVGMPGEEIRIEHGDVWVRSAATEEWTIPYRARSVQQEMWRAIDRDDPSISSWRVQSGGSDWRLHKRDIIARQDGTVRFRSERDSLYNSYFDGYPDAVRVSTNPRFSTKHVGDLRIDGEVTALPGCLQVIATICEGNRLYRFEIPGPAAAEGARPRIEVHERDGYSADSKPLDSIEAEPFQLVAGSAISFGAQNLDDRLTLELDGDWLCELDIDPVADQASTVELSVVGEGADLLDLQVSRDLYYLQGLTQGDITEIPDEHYFMLGDNTQASADGREWIAVTFEWEAEDGDTHSMRGNYRPGGENPQPGQDGDGGAIQFLRDEWGERHRIPAGAREVSRIRQSTVPRSLIRGRALAVFWPLKPSMGIWRHSWLN